MKKIFTIHFALVWLVYIFLDFICTGLCMGVPIFCIMLGFPTGWYISKRYSVIIDNKNDIIKKSFIAAIASISVTFILMLLIWGPSVVWVFDPQADFQNYGHPFFLYDPYISFIGWLILMMVVSPFLQLLTTIFAAYVTLMKVYTKKEGE